MVVQKTNAYLDSVGDMPKQIFLPLWEQRDAKNEAAARAFLAAETTLYQYLVGAKNPEAVNPNNWLVNQTLLDRPGNDQI